jgi:hypothetical protein
MATIAELELELGKERRAASREALAMHGWLGGLIALGSVQRLPLIGTNFRPSLKLGG